jgi:hypothetical protein
MNNTDDFASEFLYVNFDNILMQNNSPFLESDQMYIKYKEQYLSQTMQNYTSYKELLSLLQSFQSPSPTTPSKIVYTFTDNQQIENIRSQIKSLFLHQRTMFTNFLDHVNKLSSISPPENAKRKTLLQKIGIMPSNNRKRR